MDTTKQLDDEMKLEELRKKKQKLQEATDFYNKVSEENLNEMNDDADDTYRSYNVKSMLNKKISELDNPQKTIENDVYNSRKKALEQLRKRRT